MGSLGASFPAWIITSFKETNPAELLHLYLAHGYVLLAAVLAVEYIEAALGNGKEYFGFSNALHATSAPIWLPFNLFDQLLLELKEHSMNICTKNTTLSSMVQSTITCKLSRGCL